MILTTLFDVLDELATVACVVLASVLIGVPLVAFIS